MWISTLIVCAFATWLVVSPDKHSLTASRGLWGAARGWANPEYADTKTAKATKAKAGKSKAGKGKAGRSGAAQGPRWQGMLAGWNAGVTVARQRRTEGKDLWSIGSRFAGRTWGGGESLVVGARRLKTDLAAWYRRQKYAADGPVVQGTVIDDEPTEPKTKFRDKVRNFVVDLATGTTGSDDKPTVLRDGDDDDFEPRPPPPTGPVFCTNCAQKLVNEGKPYPSKVAYLGINLWAEDVCAGCGKTFGELHPEVFKIGDPIVDAFYEKWVAEGRPLGPLTEGERTEDLAATPAAEGAPSEGEGAPSNTTNTTMPAFAGERMNLMSEMSIGELDNIGAVRAEAEAAGQLIAMLGESIAAAKAWADNLADRWAGADWGTGPLNAAVATVAEGGQALGTTELLEAGVEAIKQAVDEASALADMAAASDASGDVSRFVDA